jgi:hypothetical protein
MKIAKVIQQAKDIARLFHIMLWKTSPEIASPAVDPAPAPPKPRSPHLANLVDPAGYKPIQIPSADQTLTTTRGKLITPETATTLLPNRDKCFACKINKDQFHIAIPTNEDTYDVTTTVYDHKTFHPVSATPAKWNLKELEELFTHSQLVLVFDKEQRILLPSLPPKPPEPTPTPALYEAYHRSIEEILASSPVMKPTAYDPFEL